MKCNKGFELEVLRSAAGFYIGTRGEYQEPNCRISKYMPRETAKEQLSEMSFEYRNAEENKFCGCKPNLFTAQP